MKFRWTSVAWSIAYLLLLLSLSTPFLIITTLFMVIPAAVLFVTLDNRQFILHVVPVWIILALIDPGFLLIAAYFLIPALVMGRWYRKRASAFSTVMAGAVTILGQFLLLLLLGTALFNFDLTDYVFDVLSMASPLMELGAGNPLLTDYTLTTEDIHLISVLTVQMIPLTLVLSSAVIAIVTHSIVRPILNSMNIAVPRMKPVREWRLPRYFIWYYFAAVVLQLMFGASDTGFMVMLSVNLLPLLQFGFKIQAIGFFFYLAYTRKWSNLLPIILAVPILLFPALWIIGVVDMVFPLRERVTKTKR